MNKIVTVLILKLQFLVIFSFFGFQIMSQEKNNDSIPELKFLVNVNCDDYTIKLYKENVLVLDTLVSDSTFSSIDYKYGYDYSLSVSKKKLITKSVKIFAKDYSKVVEVNTNLSMNITLEPLKYYKSKKPFLEPAAILEIDSTGALNYNYNYINERALLIKSYRKKKYTNK